MDIGPRPAPLHAFPALQHAEVTDDWASVILAARAIVAVTLLFELPTEREPAGPPPTALRSLRLVYGGRTAPNAFAVVTGGELLVCWQAPSATRVRGRDSVRGECFSRIDLDHHVTGTDGAASVADLRLGFLDRSTLVIGTDEGPELVVERGHGTPFPADANRGADAVPLHVPVALTCGPTGVLPSAVRGHLVWIAAPCDGALHCASPRSRPRLRRTAGMRVSLGVTSGMTTGSMVAQRFGMVPTAWHREVFVLLHVAAAFDPSLRRLQRRAQENIGAAVNVARNVPRVDDSPLRGPELQALRRILCAGAPP